MRASRTQEGPPLPADIDRLVARALAEDRIDQDRTRAAVVPAHRSVTARLIAQATGVLSGSRVAQRIAERTRLRITHRLPDGARVAPGTVVLELEGNARRLLAVERTMLNFLMHLSGVATSTRRAVRAAGGALEVRATRKTLPGLRDLEKAAVVHGGGRPHRRDLAEAILVKRPHIEIVGLDAAVRSALAAAREVVPVEIEVGSLSEAARARRAGARALLLDNVGPAGARRIVQGLGRQGLRTGATLEVSGGVTPPAVRAYRTSGVDAVSLGSLTHSAPALPIHLVLVHGSGRRPRGERRPRAVPRSAGASVTRRTARSHRR